MLLHRYSINNGKNLLKVIMFVYIMVNSYSIYNVVYLMLYKFPGPSYIKYCTVHVLLNPVCFLLHEETSHTFYLKYMLQFLTKYLINS